MTNTPALVDEAMTAISAGPHATAEHLALAEEMFKPLGRTIRVPESQQDAVTALSGSGPAYFYFLVEAMTDAGILLGLPRQVAHDLIVQTAIGSAIMLRDSGEHPVKLREAVTSPAGTTISAIRELENHGVRAALLAALEAARDRARELAAQAAEPRGRRTRAARAAYCAACSLSPRPDIWLAALRPRIDELIRLRADLAELRADLADHGVAARSAAWPRPRGWRRGCTPTGATSRRTSVQVKGFAPLLLDFPGERDGRPVLWCWLEGDADIGWYHRLDSGFAGRRPV